MPLHRWRVSRTDCVLIMSLLLQVGNATSRLRSPCLFELLLNYLGSNFALVVRQSICFVCLQNSVGTPIENNFNVGIELVGGLRIEVLWKIYRN